MVIRKFRTSDIDAALSLIRAELGPMAVILKTRIENPSIEKSSIQIEITAAVECESRLMSERHAAKHVGLQSLLPQENPTRQIANQTIQHDSPVLNAMFVGTVEVIGW